MPFDDAMNVMLPPQNGTHAHITVSTGGQPPPTAVAIYHGATRRTEYPAHTQLENIFRSLTTQ